MAQNALKFKDFNSKFLWALPEVQASLDSIVKCPLRNPGFSSQLNPFKPSGVKWLHFKVFSVILHNTV